MAIFEWNELVRRISLNDGQGYNQHNGREWFAQSLLSLTAISLLVFIVLMCEFALVRIAGSLTLSVVGIVRELLTIVLALVVFGDSLTALQVAGFGLAVLSCRASWLLVAELPCCLAL